MAKRSNQDVAFLLVDGKSLLGYTTELSDEVEALTRDTGGLDQAWPVHTPTGDYQAAFTQNGWYDDAVNGVHDILSAQQSVSRLLLYAFNGNVIGRAYSAFAGLFGAKYRRIVTKNDLHKANADYTVTGAQDEGVILHALGAETAAGDSESSSVDHGAATADGGVAHLAVTAVTLGGYDGVDIRVIHSEDNVTFVELVPFVQVAAVGGQRIPVAGAVYRYVASDWAFDGIGSGPSVTFVAGFARA